MHGIDINCDMGEYELNHPKNRDAELMNYISSCNIACGGHAGNESVIESVVDYALKHDVKIGAHPSYPDRTGFGRRVLEISTDELEQTLIKQIRTVEAIAVKKGGRLHHVKPHGALYNKAAADVTTARIIVSSIKEINSKPVLYAPAKSVLVDVARASDITVTTEAFADRTYNSDLSLVARTELNAIKHLPKQAIDQVLQIIRQGTVTSITNVKVNIQAETICIHGDHENSELIAKELFGKLNEEGITLLK